MWTFPVEMPRARGARARRALTHFLQQGYLIGDSMRGPMIAAEFRRGRGDR